MAYWVLAYYRFVAIASPEEEVARHKEFFANRDITCRIYISCEGINGQMSASVEDAKAYIEWMESDPRFAGTDFKIHTHHEQVFPRITVKVRKQLVALDRPVDLSLAGEPLSAEEWREKLETRDSKTVVIDVRNDYESKIGHFEGALLPNREQFRDFPQYAKELKEKYDPQTTSVMMYCTGGIRCEPYSALLKEEGFRKVYQLSGGIIKYGLEEGGTYWKGRLFVFDDRLSVPISEKNEQEELISECSFCSAKTDFYYNCANVDCNHLFLACPSCAEERKGCCSQECEESPRIRLFKKEAKPKPYRRLSQSPEEVL